MSSNEVWVVTDRQDSGITENEVAVFWSRAEATAKARAWIEEYRNDSRVADEIDDVLRTFDACASDMNTGLFGAGDNSCTFYVEVCRYTVF